MSTLCRYLRLHSTSSVTRREWPGENLQFCGQTNQSCVGGASTKGIHTCNTLRKSIQSLGRACHQNMSTQITKISQLQNRIFNFNRSSITLDLTPGLWALEFWNSGTSYMQLGELQTFTAGRVTFHVVYVVFPAWLRCKMDWNDWSSKELVLSKSLSWRFNSATVQHVITPWKKRDVIISR